MLYPNRKAEMQNKRSKVGSWINEGLTKKRMSIATLASICGVSRTTAYHWSDGYSTPYPENIKKLARVLDMDAKDERVAWVMEQ
jgi:predicted transcriptional regulator